ncbi:MAG TPA: pyrroloquinoline quinone biosynthesis peptide chaperone PqqD [Burkholderiaceae bacterium]|nr:pyrroloquinoline quinone biosynthesis peptide chaperone PqqD [Burkholderiaceae bacterium]
MNPIAENARLAIGKGFRLQWEPAQNAHVLLYPEGMVKLNGSAGEILRRCDGARTLAEIVADLEATFDQKGLAPDVQDFVAYARAQGWLEIAS